jgi:6-phosphogluconolactonase
MRQHAFVGTYTDGDSDGIYHLDLSTEEAPHLERTGSTGVEDNPSFLALHPKKPILYAVHEVEAGGASAFRIEADGERQTLAPLGRVESGASGPCHCSVHPSGDFLLVAHYTGGAVSVLPIREGGALDAPSDVVHHEGSSRDPERQTAAHPHSITPDPEGRFAYVPDLGADAVAVYEFDPEEGRLDRVSGVDARPGAGPRHLEFHPDGRYLYLINELDSTVCAYERDPTTGGLGEIDVESTLPDPFDGENLTADIHVHPSGEWVYGSNRGHDSIAVFAVREDGTLRSRGTVSTAGEWPRNFALDATGELLFAQNKNTDDVVSFRVDDETGDLDATGSSVSIPRPVCLAVVSESP